MRKIHELENGYVIFYDRGRFDNWCVYLTTKDNYTFAPRDEWYLAKLQEFGAFYDLGEIYNDFLRIYYNTTHEIQNDTLQMIVERTRKYDIDADRIAALLIVIYAGMVAEERKENTKLGKRIKRLGMHQSLVEGMNAKIAANFSRGKPWREIARECEQRGF